MNAALIFISTFILVFALGFQSLNVNNGHYKMAFITSIAIGGSNLILLKTVPQADFLEIVAYLTSGPFAIVASMWAHSKFVKKPKYTTDEIAKHFKVPERFGVDSASETDITEIWETNSAGDLFCKWREKTPQELRNIWPVWGRQCGKTYAQQQGFDKDGNVENYNPIPQPTPMGGRKVKK